MLQVSPAGLPWVFRCFLIDIRAVIGGKCETICVSKIVWAGKKSGAWPLKQKTFSPHHIQSSADSR